MSATILRLAVGHLLIASALVAAPVPISAAQPQAPVQKQASPVSSALRSAIQGFQIPGAGVVVVHQGKVVLTETAGVAAWQPQSNQ
jgi:CubicO group peptidase (beta-lactamase class C family)